MSVTSIRSGWLLFAGDRYYAKGGIDDFRGSFPTLSHAILALRDVEADYSGSWAHAVNSRSGKRHDFRKQPSLGEDWVEVCQGECGEPLAKCWCGGVPASTD